MKHIIRLGTLGGVLLLCVASYPVPVRAVGEVTNVMIAELSPEAIDSASKEYVQLFNGGSEAVDMAGWRLQYRSASHTPDNDKDWVNKAILGCKSVKTTDCITLAEVLIRPQEMVKVSSFETGDGVLPLVSGMATAGGQLRLVRPATGGAYTVVDMVGYGTAKDFEGDKPAPAPLPGRSIIRGVDENGIHIDTNRNNLDFELKPDEETEPPLSDTTPPSDPAAPPDTTGPVQPVVYLPAEITEVMPDPASPQLDSNDEFIELYNPHDEPLNMHGYSIVTGANWTHKYVIPDLTIEPHAYVALTAAQTHLTLSNSGSGVRLLDPASSVVSEVPTYGLAKTGDSWARDVDGQWVWTTKPTPGEQNSIEVPAEPVPKVATGSVKKPAKAPSSASKKAITPKTTGSVKAATTTAAQPTPGQTPQNPAGMWALGVAGTLGTGYGLYEYRQDASDFIRRRWQRLASVFKR